MMRMSPLLGYTLMDALQDNTRSVIFPPHELVQPYFHVSDFTCIVTKTWPKRYLPRSWRKCGLVLCYAIHMAQADSAKLSVRMQTLKREARWDGARLSPIYTDDKYASFLPFVRTIGEVVYHIKGWEKMMVRQGPGGDGIVIQGVKP